MTFFSTLLISVLLTVVTIPALTMLALRLQMLDVPDERKMHTVPVPRCGGIAIAFGAFTPIAYWYAISDPFIAAFLTSASIIVFFGIADDFLGLSPRWKFIGQIVAALIVIYWGRVNIVFLGALLPEGILLPVGVAVLLTMLVLVGVTNAVNMSDGLDGLAGGVCLMNLCFIGYLAFVTGEAQIALVSLALVGAIFGFLRFNTHPASIFMGDSGSQLLGFSAVTLSLLLTQRVTAFSPLVPLLLFGIPVLDTLTVIVTRIRRGRSPFSPDKRHFHHRLLEIGLSHTEAVLTIYLIQAVLVFLTFLLRFYSSWLLLFVYLIFSMVLLTFFHYARRTDWKQKRWPVIIQLKTWFITVQAKRRVQAISCPCFKYLFYSLIFLSSLLPVKSDLILTSACIIVSFSLLLIRYFRPEALVISVRFLFYLVVPFVVYWGDRNLLPWFGSAGDRVLNIAFILLLTISTVISVFSTRRKGIWSTPLDFLILLLMLIVPNLAGLSFQGQRLGVVGLKCLILVSSLEVLLAETRGNFKGVSLTMALSLFVFALKSIL